jgi:hypothetical protein
MSEHNNVSLPFETEAAYREMLANITTTDLASIEFNPYQDDFELEVRYDGSGVARVSLLFNLDQETVNKIVAASRTSRPAG